MSAFLMVELTMRKVESLRSSLARIASLTALLMSSRSMKSSFTAVPAGSIWHPMYGFWAAHTTLEPLTLQPAPDRSHDGLRLLHLRHVPALRHDLEHGARNELRHLPGEFIGDQQVLIARKHQRRNANVLQIWARVLAGHDCNEVTRIDLGA